MAPNSRWTPEKTEALLNALGKTLLKTATLAQKESIEGHMKDAGYDATWEAVRYVVYLFILLCIDVTIEHGCAAGCCCSCLTTTTRWDLPMMTVAPLFSAI